MCAVVLAVLVLAACAPSEPAASPTPEPTPIERLNTTAMEVPRIPYCDQVPQEAVDDAVEGAGKATDYGNGDTEATSGVRDALHELGCVWTGEGGATARTWLFARPATDALAQQVARADARVPGCRVVGGPAFGDPSTTQQCTFGDARSRVRHAGLFGQTWLACEVTGPPRQPVAEVRDRADAWCVEVLEALTAAS